jgi:hypothetical protein
MKDYSGKWVIPLGDITCPKCGKRGQLKLRRRVMPDGPLYRSVDHYRMKKIRKSTKMIHGKYMRSCYLGLGQLEFPYVRTVRLIAKPGSLEKYIK